MVKHTFQALLAKKIENTFYNENYLLLIIILLILIVFRLIKFLNFSSL